MIEEAGGIRRKGNKFTSYKVRKQHGEYCYGILCNWEIFKDYFWETVDWKEILQMNNYKREPYKNLSAIAVWTEIFSIIEGSLESHTYPERHLPFDKYLKKSKNIFLGYLEKKTIF